MGEGELDKQRQRTPVLLSACTISMRHQVCRPVDLAFQQGNNRLAAQHHVCVGVNHRQYTGTASDPTEAPACNKLVLAAANSRGSAPAQAAPSRHTGTLVHQDVTNVCLTTVRGAGQRACTSCALSAHERTGAPAGIRNLGFRERCGEARLHELRLLRVCQRHGRALATVVVQQVLGNVGRLDERVLRLPRGPVAVAHALALQRPLRRLPHAPQLVPR